MTLKIRSKDERDGEKTDKIPLEGKQEVMVPKIKGNKHEIPTTFLKQAEKRAEVEHLDWRRQRKKLCEAAGNKLEPSTTSAQESGGKVQMFRPTVMDRF